MVCTDNYRFYVLVLFILVLCHFNIISGWLQYCIYHKIHVTRNISLNFRIYSTNFKTSKDFNAISTYAMYLQSTIYTNIDIRPVRMTQAVSKRIGLLVP